MIKKLLFIVLSLSLINCKAQKMNIITLDPDGEKKQLYDNTMFKENYDVIADNSIVTKSNQEPVSGTLTVKFNNGEMYAMYTYVAGRQEGDQVVYFSNGNKRAEWNVSKGKHQGKAIYYHENGNKKSIVIYDNGVKTRSENYYENGNLMDEVSYENGKKNGASKLYYDTGKLKSTATYERGNLTGKVFNYYQNGVVESKGEIYQESVFKEFKNGIWEYFYENGNKKEEGAWGLGGRHGNSSTKKGVWKYYNEEGLLKMTETYDDTLGRLIKTEKHGN